MTWSAGVDLLAQLAHEDVYGPISCGEAATPDLLEQLVPRHHSRALLGEGVEEPELGRRETGTAAVQVRLDADGVDPQLLELDLPTAFGRLRANAAPARP